MNRQMIEGKALKLAEEYGFANITKAQLCHALDIPDGSFRHYSGCSFTEFCEEMRRKFPSPAPGEITRARVNPEDRRAHLVDKALLLSKAYGFERITRLQLSKFAGVSASLVSQHFTMVQLRQAILERAIEVEDLDVIAQGWVRHHKATQGLDSDLADKVCDYLRIENNR